MPFQLFALDTLCVSEGAWSWWCHSDIIQMVQYGKLLYDITEYSGGQFSPSAWPHNPATGFQPPSATVVSAEPFSHGTGTLRCLQKEMVTYRHWSASLWQDPDDVSHCRILSPDKTEWRLISATLCGWICCFVHTRRRRLRTCSYKCVIKYDRS